jgi:hypothetical protein
MGSLTNGFINIKKYVINSPVVKIFFKLVKFIFSTYEVTISIRGIGKISLPPDLM